MSPYSPPQASVVPEILLLDDTTTANVLYVGTAPMGTALSASAWKIKKVDLSSGVSVKWAGTGTHDQVWNNRSILSYA